MRSNQSSLGGMSKVHDHILVLLSTTQVLVCCTSSSSDLIMARNTFYAIIWLLLLSLLLFIAWPLAPFLCIGWIILQVSMLLNNFILGIRSVSIGTDRSPRQRGTDGHQKSKIFWGLKK